MGDNGFTATFGSIAATNNDPIVTAVGQIYSKGMIHHEILRKESKRFVKNMDGKQGIGASKNLRQAQTEIGRLNQKVIPELQMQLSQLPVLIETVNQLDQGIRDICSIESDWKSNHESASQECASREEIAASGVEEWKNKKISEIDAQAQHELQVFAGVAKENLGLGELPKVPLKFGGSPPSHVHKEETKKE